MTPFYNFSQGISLQANGESLGDISALNLVNGTVTVVSGVANFTAPETSITDGAILISPLNTLTVNSLSLSAELVFPTIRQAVPYNGGGNNFGAVPLSGSRLVAVMTPDSVPAPEGWTLETSIVLNGLHALVYGQVSNGTMPASFSGFNGPGASYEIVGGGTPDYVSSAMAVASGEASLSGTLLEGIMIGCMIELPDQNPPNPGSIVPAGITFNSQQQGPGGNGGVWLLEGSITTEGTILSFADAGMTAAVVSYVIIPALSEGNAAITG